MAKIIFIAHDGTRREVAGVDGESLMEAAVGSRIPGIDGDCGGCCACATCQVTVQEPWLSKLAPMAKDERQMLEAVSDPEPSSRLACQIRFSAALDGIEVRTPESQH